MTRPMLETPIVKLPVKDRTKLYVVPYPPEVTDRHRDEAYKVRFNELMADGEGQADNPFWHSLLKRLQDMRFEDPAVKLIAEVIAKQEAVELQLMARAGVNYDGESPE